MGNNLTVIILAYSRIENVKKSICLFCEANISDVKLVVILDRDVNNKISTELLNYCNDYNVEFELSGGLGHDLVYKKALLNYNNSHWKWILNDSIILDPSKLLFLNSSLIDKNDYDCVFLTNPKVKLFDSPIWYATRTGWTVLKTKYIPINFISNNLFKNFPQLMVFYKSNLNFCQLNLSLDVNKITPSYWINNFWSTWYIDFINTLFKLGDSEEKIKHIAVFHANKNHFFSIISLLRWPKSFYADFRTEFSTYLSRKQYLYFKFFKIISKIRNR